MNEVQCAQCESYIQHYILRNGKLYRIFCGHCLRFPAKRKRPYAPACEHFVPGEADTNSYVGKEFLTKKLLERVLNMELLPNIEDAPPELP